VPSDRIAEFCRKWKIRELALFGSVLRDGLKAIFGREVDRVEKEGLRNPSRRQAICAA